jgi:hypothetical protein
LAQWLPGIAIVAVILVVDATWRSVGPLVAFDDFVSAHRGGLLTLTIALAVLGVLGVVGPLVHGMVTEGHRIPDAELPGVAAAQFNTQLMAGAGGGPTAGFSLYRFWGKAIGISFEETDTFSEIRTSWRSGAWLHETRYLRVTIGIIGLFVALFGVFGIFVVLPILMGIKVVELAALVYAVVRFSWGMSRA